MNSCVLIGRLGQDPELKYFDSGSCKARFTLAIDRNVGKNNAQTDWFTVEAWAKLAEFAGEWLKKGTLISVAGSIEVQRWKDQTGNTREMPVVRATEIRLEGSRRDGTNPSSGGGGGYQAPASADTVALSPF
jgi:single-strand DNA-binding protein